MVAWRLVIGESGTRETTRESYSGRQRPDDWVPHAIATPYVLVAQLFSQHRTELARFLGVGSDWTVLGFASTRTLSGRDGAKKREIVLQELLAADFPWVADHSKLTQHFIRFGGSKIRILKKKSKAKRKH